MHSSTLHSRFKDELRKGPGSRTIIRVLLHEILRKRVNLPLKSAVLHCLVDGLTLLGTAGELTLITLALPRVL